MVREDFRFYKPCVLLRPYVRYYWVFSSRRSLSALTFPIGCPQLIFHRRTPLYIRELAARQPRLAVSGQVNFPAHLQAEGDTEMVVVVFRPCGLGAFLRLPVSALHNREVCGYDLDNRGLEELAARVFGCARVDACIGLIEEWLLAQLGDAPEAKGDLGRRRVATAVERLLAAPETPVTALASIACLGKKQFERLFAEQVGANPKEYARIARFQKSLKCMQSHPGGISQAQLAYHCGYADQSHFIREFRQFSGYTPGALLKVCAPYSDLFTDPS